MDVPLVAAAAVVLLSPALVIAGRVLWQVVRRRRPLPGVLLGPGLLAGVALTALGYAAVVYAIGFLSGFYVLDPDQMCAAAAGFYSGRPGPPDSSWTGIDYGHLPLRRTCRWAGGTTHELVPGWVNPLWSALLAVAWAALLARPLATLVAPRWLGRTR
ncbi:hypothetical protein [Spirilliplanes yamanashiensis]|nr:hypothetical protein [Spirilliplanes yamanashiensis]MDP9819408.1 hypothetical protein [Spirilliplanes yamanashiensis]